jgi:hypothetical protein
MLALGLSSIRNSITTPMKSKYHKEAIEKKQKINSRKIE